MRTNHTYVCTECGKEHAKDWAYKPGHDDDPAMCDACFGRQPVVESVKDGVATLRDKRTGIRWHRRRRSKRTRGLRQTKR